MPITIFNQNRINNAKAFLTSFFTDSIYLYVGRSFAWADDTSPPISIDTVSGACEIWNNMSGAVRLTLDDVSLGIKRNNWTSGTIYEKYSSTDVTLGSGTGFVVLAGYNDRDVYKCLDNNGDSQSSVKPSHKHSGISKEADGYVWMYMYTLTDLQFSRFATSNVLPVVENRSISALSSPGSFLHVPISANSTAGIGKDYRGTGFSNGTVGVSTVNATIFTTVLSDSLANEIKVVADSGLAIVDDYFSNSMFLVNSGPSKGKLHLILASNPPASKALSDDNTSNLVFSTPINNIANGDSFIIGPYVSIEDDLSGIGYEGIAQVNSYGNVTSIETISAGGLYAGEPAITVHGTYLPTSNAFPQGSDATVNAITSPTLGHGFRNAEELNATFVIISGETTIPRNHETGSFIGYGNQIRQYGLVKNPMSSWTGRLAQEQTYDTRTSLYFKTPTVIPFSIGDTVNNGLTGATATGIIDNICGAIGNQYLSLVNTQGRFANGDVIYNQMGYNIQIHSGSLDNYFYPLDGLSSPISPVLDPGLYKYSGELLYNENIAPITRRIDQKENFQIIFEF
jgi:hypothetical protein